MLPRTGAPRSRRTAGVCPSARAIGVSQSTAGITGNNPPRNCAAAIVPRVIAASPKRSSTRRLTPLSFSRCSRVIGDPGAAAGAPSSSRAFPPRAKSAGAARQIASQATVTMTSAATAPDMIAGSVSKAPASA